MLKLSTWHLPVLIVMAGAVQAQPLTTRQPVSKPGATNPVPSIETWKPSHILNPISAEELIGTRVYDRKGQPVGRVGDIIVASGDHRIQGVQVAPYYLIRWSQFTLARDADGLKITAHADPSRVDATAFADTDPVRAGVQAKLFHASDLRRKHVLLNGGVRFGNVTDLVFDGTGKLAAAETWLSDQPTPPEIFYADALDMGSYMLPIPQTVSIEPDLAYLVLPYDLEAVQKADPDARLSKQVGDLHEAMPPEPDGRTGAQGVSGSSRTAASATRPLPLDDASGWVQGQSAALAGTYRLVSLNGKPLPFEVSAREGCSASVISAALELSAERSYLAKSLVREDCGETSTFRQTVNQRGNWAYANNALQLNRNSGGSGSSAPPKPAAPLPELAGTATQDGGRLMLTLADGGEAVLEPTDDAGIGR